MTNSPRAILCAACNVSVQVRVEPNKENIVFCPRCGVSDTEENVIREASESVMDELVRKTIGPERTAGRGVVTITVKHPPKRRYRFIMGDEAHL